MTPDQAEQLAAYIADARWFGAKGRAFTVTSVIVLGLAPDVSTNLVEVSFEDGGSALYQLPLSSYDEPQERLAHAAIGLWQGQHHYDAVHDRDAMSVWLRAFAGEGAEARDPSVEFVRTSDHALDLESHSTVFSGEQSNSSMAFGEDALLKVYRRLTPGANPDIEIHEALTRSGSTDIAELFGYVRATDAAGDLLHLGMLQQFLRTASDGWELALASARNLFTEGDLHADEVGGDFAAEAHRLGATLAEVHALLAAEFGTGETSSADLAATMSRRLDDARSTVPDLEDLAGTLAACFDAVRPLGTLAVQRVHGDLHLGQTLRTSLGWKLVDFEGEPAKDLAERRLPDSIWRDVAGMIRSLDYAASSVARDLASGGDEAVQVAYRAAEWTRHNSVAFLAGYTEVRGAALTVDEEVLLAAYVADKAIYEAVYETRNRPGWLMIPLNALGRLAEASR
jgi:maltokinase